jgi:hypothetical protein
MPRRGLWTVNSLDLNRPIAKFKKIDRKAALDAKFQEFGNGSNRYQLYKAARKEHVRV